MNIAIWILLGCCLGLWGILITAVLESKKGESSMNLEEKVDQLSTEMQIVRGDLRDIKTALTGFNGNSGLLKNFENHCLSNDEMRDEFQSFRRQCLIIFGILIGSGVLGVSVLGVVSRLGG